MSQNVAVFFTQSSGFELVSLRRYRSRTHDTDQDGKKIGEAACPHPGNWGYHNAETLLGKMPERLGEMCSSGRGRYGGIWRESEFKGDPRWPARCACGYEFHPELDNWQVFTDDVMVRADGLSGEYSKRKAVVGMMWDCFWWEPRHTSVNGGAGWSNVGPDGLTLAVCVPALGTDGQWRAREFMPEMRASNCTLPNDGDHHCWVREGDARKNQCHIGKNGKTCAAGAGSIVTPGWHGFIHHGFVTDVPDVLVR